MMNSKMNTPQLFNEICLITDLDDTLLNSSHEISRENLEAIQEFIKLGGEFGIATGRGAQSVKRLSIPSTLPAILYNGSTIMDISSGHIHWNRPLEAKDIFLVEELLRYFPGIGIEVFTYDGIYLITENEETNRHTTLEHIIPIPLKNNKYQTIPGAWQKILIAWDVEHLKEVEAFLAPLSGTKYSIKFHRSYDFLVEIIHPGCGKEVALRQLSRLIEIPMKQIIAVGDNQNDLSFIQCAGIGVAAGNALPAVKEVADYVAVDHDQHIMTELLYLLKTSRL